MRRIESIRRWLLRDPVQSSALAAFWLLLSVALLVAGPSAARGLPALAQMLLPPGLMAAQAGASGPAEKMVMPVDVAHGETRYATQVLTPVPARGFPDWLTQRVAFIREHGEAALSASGQTDAPRPAIAIVIDDVGIDIEAARAAIALPRKITLSFLPYPPDATALARVAARRGHQVLLHMPMEPEGRENPGPDALFTTLTADEISERLNRAFQRVPNAAGMNNHMGSRFTQDRVGVIAVMRALSARHVFFLDSRTAPQSVAAEIARIIGVPSGMRDVFLDDAVAPGAILQQLAETERVARAHGVAIAIGHPHPDTLKAVAAWSRDVELKGFELVDVQTAISLQAERDARSFAHR